MPDNNRPIYSLLALALIMLALTCSCSDETGFKGPVEMQLWDIVTYEGSTDGGDRSRFTFRQVDDSPLITLISPTLLPAETTAGTRMIIRYIPESGEAYTSGNITLLSAARINQSPVATEWKEEFDNWNRDKVYLYSVWRTGNHLNFHVRLTYDPEPRLFQLAADPATIGTEYPDIYLVHIMASPTDYHDRAYFASFDIAGVWNSPQTKGIRLHVANTNLDQQEFTFVKDI